MSSLTAITTESFDAEVRNRRGLTLVDFWASWCRPCHMLTPTLERVAAERGDRVRIVKVDIEESPDIASRYWVKNIPMMFLFKDGQVVDQLPGLQPKSRIEHMLDAHA